MINSETPEILGQGLFGAVFVNADDGGIAFGY